MPTRKTKVYKYDDAFRKSLLKAVKQGMPVSEVAEKAGIAPSALYGWMKQAHMKNPGHRPEKSGTSVIMLDRHFKRPESKGDGAMEEVKQTKSQRQEARGGDAYHAAKVASAYLANAIRYWDSAKAKPLVELALIELREAL